MDRFIHIVVKILTPVHINFTTTTNEVNTLLRAKFRTAQIITSRMSRNYRVAPTENNHLSVVKYDAEGTLYRGNAECTSESRTP